MLLKAVACWIPSWTFSSRLWAVAIEAQPGDLADSLGIRDRVTSPAT